MLLNKKLTYIQTWLEEYLVDLQAIFDVGCDHGKLLASLYQRHKHRSIAFFGSDIKKASLDKAVHLFQSHFVFAEKNFPQHLVLKVGAGLLPFLPLPEKSAVIVAGMGGEEIIDILRQSDLPKGTKFFLHPTKSQAFVRDYLKRHSFIYEERFCLDKGMLYTLIYAELTLSKKAEKSSIAELKKSFLEKQSLLSLEALKQVWIGQFSPFFEQSLEEFDQSYALYLHKLLRYFSDQCQSVQAQVWQKQVYQYLKENFHGT